MWPPPSHAGWSRAPVCGGARSNPRQKYTDAETVQLRAPLRPNPQAPDKEPGITVCRNIGRNIVENF